jgi:hypothetical protein
VPLCKSSLKALLNSVFSLGENVNDLKPDPSPATEKIYKLNAVGPQQSNSLAPSNYNTVIMFVC